MGDVVPLPAAARHARRAAQGPRPRTAWTARQRRDRFGTDRRHAEGHLLAGRAAEARIHGKCAQAVGATRLATAQAAAAVAWLRPRALARDAGRAGAARSAR